MKKKTFATATPSDYPIESAFGYTTNGRNFPGLLSLTFQPSSTIAGYSITGQSSLLALSFPNLTSLPAGALAFTASTNVAMTSLSAPVLAYTGVAITVSGNTVLTQVNFPSLVSGPATGSGIGIHTNAALNSILFPLLATTPTAISFTGNPLLVTVNLASLVTVNGLTITGPSSLASLSLPLVTSISSAGSTGLVCVNNASLSTFSAPNWTPTNTRQILFAGCALSQASVDHILARAVSNPGYVSGTIDLLGGTNATPGVQGQLDKATLIARGCTVLTN